jgi:hypothetical protein
MELSLTKLLALEFLVFESPALYRAPCFPFIGQGEGVGYMRGRERKKSEEGP